MKYRKSEPLMKEIYVFDIDGCVLPQVFPNITEKSSTSEIIIKESLEKSKSVSLYNEFIDFYERNCMGAHYIVFITGRQSLPFGKMTEGQLSSLRIKSKFDIIYYPEDKEHLVSEYYDWKVEKVQEVIHTCNSNKEFVFKIYDDMPEYFPRIREFARNNSINVSFTPIKGPGDWVSCQ